MKRLTVPAERLPDGGTRIQVVDARAVREHAMELYWRLKEYEGTGLSPDDVTDLMGSHAFAIGELAKVPKWIPVTERLPEEHDSMFAKWYGTPLWQPGMFRTTSGDVLVCVEFGEGSRVVSTARTNAGEWNISSIFSGKVTHWMPLPNPPKEVPADA